MPDLDYNIIFWFILGIFTLSAAILTTATLVNVIRLRNVRISWNSGKIWGYPLFASVFLVSAVGAIAIALRQGSVEEIIISALYGWLGLCWFTASFYAAKRFITDHGIVKNVNEPSQTVAWHQIRDFFEREHSNTTRYVFIYCPDELWDPTDVIRLELDVPNKERESFKKLISHKLGHRIRCYVDDDIDIKQFE